MTTHAKEALLQTTANRDIRQGYVDTPDGQVHYWSAGAGPTLLLVHQSSSSVEEYAGLVPHLKDHFRLVTYDWPGHGASDDPTAEPGVKEYAEAGLAVLDHLDLSEFHVLGHHGGALIAMYLAYTYPDRTQRVVLSGTSGLRDEEATEAFTESLDLEKRHHLERDGKSLSDAWQRYTQYLPSLSPEKILVVYVANIVTRLRPYDAHYGVLRWNRRPALESLKDRPVLLIQGENDEFVSHQETLLKVLPQAERVVFKNAGTFLFYEQPQEISELLATFLNG